MKFQPTDYFVISDEVLSQEINGETVLLDLESESYFGLNEIGTRIWQVLESEHCVAETLDTLSDETANNPLPANPLKCTIVSA